MMKKLIHYLIYVVTGLIIAAMIQVGVNIYNIINAPVEYTSNNPLFINDGYWEQRDQTTLPLLLIIFLLLLVLLALIKYQ